MARLTAVPIPLRLYNADAGRRLHLTGVQAGVSNGTVQNRNSRANRVPHMSRFATLSAFF